MSKHGDTSVCLKCEQPIEFIDPQDGNPGVWRHVNMPPEIQHDVVPPLMLDETHILAYDEEHEVFILKLGIDQMQCIRTALIEMFDKRDTLNWKDAGKLFHQLTSEMREMDRLPGVLKNQQNISYDLSDRKCIKLTCTECGEFVRELVPAGQSRADTNDRIWHLAGEHTRETHSRDDSLNWTGKLEETK